MIKRVKLKFIRSYLLITLMIVAIFGAQLLVSERMMSEDLQHKNEIMLEYVKKSIDGVLSDMSTMVFEIDGNSWIAEYDAVDTITTEQAARITRYLNLMHSANPIIRDLAVYYPKQNIVITDSGRYLPEHYYLLYNRCVTDDAESYLDHLSQTYVLELRLEKAKSGHQFTFYHSCWGHTMERGPLLMITLDNAEIELLLNNVKLDNSEAFAIVSSQGELIAGIGSEELLTSITYTVIDGEARIVSSDSSMVAMHTQSDYLGMHYVTIAQQSAVEGTLSTIRFSLLIGMVLTIIVGILCAIWLGGQNIKPLNSLSEMIRIVDTGAVDEEDTEQDFFTYVENQIQRMALEKKDIRMRMESQRGILKQVFVAALLRGETVDDRQFVDYCTSTGIDFVNKLHCAFVLSISGGELPVVTDAPPEEDPIQLMIDETLSHISGLGKCSAEIVYLDGLYVGWLMLHDEVGAERRCKEYLDALTTDLKENYAVEAMAFSGSICESFQQLRISRSEAVWTMHIAAEQNLAGNFIWQDVRDDREQNNVQNGMGVFSAFVNSLRIKDFSGADKLVEDLVRQYLNPYLSSRVYLLRKKAVLSVAIDALEQSGYTGSSVVEQVEACKEKLFATKSLEQFPNALHETLRTLDAISSGGNECTHQNIEQIKSYIEQNYADPDMGLALLSEHFSVSTTYLSRYIKAELGTGVLDYVNKLRVEEMCRLLKETNMTVTQIAESVGYSSDIVCIRVFKRYEGITPGKYRAMVRNT